MSKGNLVLSTGTTNLYNIGEDFFLYKKVDDEEILITDTTMVSDYEKQIGDNPTGRSLVVGMGLGIPSHIVLRNPEVHALVSIEPDPNVIAIQSELNAIVDSRHSLLLNKGENFLSRTALVFDYIYFDFYKDIDDDTIAMLKIMVPIAKKRLRDESGIVHGWYKEGTSTAMTNKLLEVYEIDTPWW